MVGCARRNLTWSCTHARRVSPSRCSKPVWVDCWWFSRLESGAVIPNPRDLACLGTILVVRGPVTPLRTGVTIPAAGGRDARSSSSLVRHLGLADPWPASRNKIDVGGSWDATTAFCTSSLAFWWFATYRGANPARGKER
jgi:hypothetical protein